MFQQSQELYRLASVYWLLADLTALEKESLFEVEEDGACEPWGFEVQDAIPLGDSAASFALTRYVLDFLFSKMWPRIPVLLKCMLWHCNQYMVACSYFQGLRERL